MSTNDNPNYENYPDEALEEDITRGSVYDRNYRTEPGTDAGSGDDRPDREPDGIRTGTLVWGVIALLVALWSLSVTVLDWDIDPVLVSIGLAVVGGVALLAGGIVGATRNKTN
jgi:hypothetical protein